MQEGTERGHTHHTLPTHTHTIITNPYYSTVAQVYSPLCMNTNRESNMGTISELRVCQSASGFYIGRTFTEPDVPFEQPYSRDSIEYYPTSQLAQLALDNNTYTTRMS